MEKVKQTIMDEAMIKNIMREYKRINCDITFDMDATVDDLIDALDGKRSYIPCIYVLNKIDAVSMEELDILTQLPHFVPVSGNKLWNFEELMETIWDYLNVV